MPVKVLVYEDNAALRNSIQTLMQWSDEFEMVAAMPDAEGILDDVSAFSPDVILMDIDMPPSNGVETLKVLHQKYENLAVIIFKVI